MPRELQLVLAPEAGPESERLLKELKRRFSLSYGEMDRLDILQKSLDARHGKISWQYRLRVWLKGEEIPPAFFPAYRDVSRAPKVLIAGMGPAGLFCALRLMELGLKPVLFERGSEVGKRKKDVAMLSRGNEVNPDSNYCFGEGGAGTFSDGKLYTRSKKRGDVEKVLNVLAFHGAPPQILYDSHPHIGTDRLPGVIRRIRESILQYGGEIYFDTRLEEIHHRAGRLYSVELNPLGKLDANALVLATGHSSKEVYEWLFRAGIRMEAKGFAMGVRVEHPQSLIDKIQYHGIKSLPDLPPASYRLVSQAGDRGVYSFCMCPGGFILPSVTAPGELLVNGMSPWKRNSGYANSGIVAEIREQDLPMRNVHGLMAGLRYQEELERNACIQGGDRQKAPAQRLSDFVAGKFSSSLPACSYFPGIQSSSLHEWLPSDLYRALCQGFRLFDKKMKGFLSREGVVVGVESRTSSPLRILRDEDRLMSVSCEGLFPCGEGAGYAGGILSSAVDGERVAEKVFQWMG